MKENLSYNQYDRITDTLLYLSNTVTVSFNVSFSRKNKSGERVFYEFETEYPSKFIGTQMARSIKRNMNFYFSIDDKEDFGNGIILRPSEIGFINLFFENQVMPWFYGDERIYSEKDNQLIITGKYSPAIFTKDEYKYIHLEPIVLSYEDGTFSEGIRFFMNNETNFIDLSLDKFYSMVYIFKNTDMYSVAATLSNYVKIGPYGTNIYRPVGLGSGTTPQNWNEAYDVSYESKNHHQRHKKNSFLEDAKKKGE